MIDSIIFMLFTFVFAAGKLDREDYPVVLFVAAGLTSVLLFLYIWSLRQKQKK